jgi:Mg2+ and Co2+ transporter CorA
LFSLQNIPWGWVAILIILVLFATVLYLLFNKEKI